MAFIKKLKPHEFAIPIGKQHLLDHLDLELTERCNNNCIHCCINLPENDPVARNREMETDFVKKVLTQAAGLGCLTVRFTGGEPLLREDFFELYEFTRRLGMRVMLFTNGRLLTPKLAALLARIPPGRAVEVSVYGIRPESYDRTARQKGAFAEFRRGVALLEEYRIPFVVKAALLPSLKGDLEEFETWAQTIPWMKEKPVYSTAFNLRSRRDDPAKSARIAGLRATPEESADVMSRSLPRVADVRQFFEKTPGQPGDPLFLCGAGRKPCVDAYGKVQMCMNLRDPETVVDLRTEPETGLRRALTEFFPKLRQRRATNPEYLNRCARCFLLGFCEQCPAKSWMENGTFDTPVEYLCRTAHAQARRLGLIAENENAWEVRDGRERIQRLS